jgi:hypothetical protein
MLLLLVGLWLCGTARTEAQGTPPTPTQVKTHLDRILSSPEFRPETGGENPLVKVFRWIGERWDAFWNWIRSLFHFGGLGSGLPGLQWLFIACFIALAAWILSKLILNYWKYRERSAPKERTAFDYDEAEPDTIQEPDIWLQQAQRYASDGDYRRAFRAVFLAILLQLDHAGAIQYDRTRTNGDYLRLLRAGNLGALYDAFRPLVFEFDVRWYGDRPTQERDYRRCRDEFDRIRGLLTTQ